MYGPLVQRQLGAIYRTGNIRLGPTIGIFPSRPATSTPAPPARGYARRQLYRPSGHSENQTQQHTFEQSLQQLEFVLQAHALKRMPIKQVERLSQAYNLFHEIDTYTRHQSASPDISQSAERTLQQSRDVAPKSGAARGQHAISTLLRIMLDTISSISPNSKLRKKNPAIFDAATELDTLMSESLKGVEQEDHRSKDEWDEFWIKAKDQVARLGDAFTKSGFGGEPKVDEDVAGEKERQDKFWEIVMGMVEEERKEGRGQRKK